MKLVLHIGMPKSGTSALQASLRTAEATLRLHGILYPSGRGLPKNHNMLVCGVLDPAKLPRIFKQTYGGDTDRLAREFGDFMAGLERAVARARPDTLILSGEMLFRPLGPARIDALRAQLARLSDDVRVVAYVRSPAQFYAAQAQQVLKASRRIAPLRPISYRAELEAYDRLAAEVQVIAYERSKLRGADIARDFLHRLAPELADTLAPSSEANQTISAEGMDILQRYRARIHPDADSVFTRDTGVLVRAIAALDSGIAGFGRPRLLEPVHDYLNAASVDLLWLRDRHGVVFSDVDYGRISDRLDPPPTPRRVAGICEIDRRRRERLVMALLHHLAAPLAGARPVRFKSAPGRTGRRRHAPARGE